MKELDRKIAEVFPNEFVYKDDRVRALFSGVYIPSFIKDWIIKRFF
jgi:ATP-dependent Lon protease